MSTPDLSAEPKFRLADRLAAARRGRFVGREAEIDLFRSALLAAEPPFVVLHIYGPGGVGKTTLLREYARLAAESGRPVIRLDGRNLDPSPPGFLLALDQALGNTEPAGALPNWPPHGVLVIDTYETLAPLDLWLRETFLPQLPAQCMVVIAGRYPPAAAWRTDIAWSGLARLISLRNLRPEESQTYLAVRGIPAEHHPEVLSFTHGHPLALSLLADVLSQGNQLAAFRPQNEPDVVRVLLEHLVQDVPSAGHRLALDICVLAWATTEALLAEVVGGEEAHALFEWLRRLSFIEQGPYGLFPHDLAREVLDADLRWRNPDRYQGLQQQVSAHLHARFARTTGLEQQRTRLDLLYINRHDPGLKAFFDWDAFGSAYAEPAAPEDAVAIIEMVRTHQGEASAQIACYWLRRQPQAFLVFRTLEGELFGFMANLELNMVTPEDLATDPAIPAALNFAQNYGPVRPGEEIVYLRFWMGRDTYQAIAPAVNLAASNSVTYWVTHPRLAWNFIAIADPDFFQPHFASIHMQRSPEADFEVDGRRYGLFTHDWRVEPASAWQGRRFLPPASAPEPEKPALPLLVLSQPEFEEAVRQAFRDYTRPDLLAASPLMRSRLVIEAAEAPATPATLQALLREAAATLTGNPRDEKLYRALYHTYLEPAPSQERAAELLDLPFSTYRYHLANGLKRLTDRLWQRELHDLEG